MESNLAVLIDFENIAAGTEKEGLGRFDVDTLMKRLKDKGRILVSRSYADWGRFARFKQTLLTCNVTMMELTSHGMQDKNRADIAMVVDCLELAFTKDYIDTFVVVSGDSDFTPLVLKMRELNKKVIGCGTRSSTSRLLIQACDEFIFYDTVVKEARPARTAASKQKRSKIEDAYELLVDALAGMQRENPDPVLASVVKTAMLRKSPDFNETDHAFPTFARFLESAAEAGHVSVSRDQKSGGYRVDSADASSDTTRQRRRRTDREPEENGEGDWLDPYVPKASSALVKTLAKDDIDPLAFPTRMTVLQDLEHVAADRRKRRRRVNVQFVQEDLRKRLRKTHPELPAKAIKGIFTALMRGGLLLHRDGNPIRSGNAPFVLEKDAEALNKELIEVYLDALRAAKADLSDVAGLAELLLGDKERTREIEEVLAWLSTRGSDDEDEDETTDEEPIELDLDDVLLTEEAAAEAPAEAEQAAAEAPAEEEPAEAPAADDGSAEAEQAPKKPRARKRTRAKAAEEEANGVPADEQDGAEQPAAAEAAEAAGEEPKPRRRTTRRRKSAEPKAAEEPAVDDLDALLQAE